MVSDHVALVNPYGRVERFGLPERVRARSSTVRRALALGAMTAGLGVAGAGAASASDIDLSDTDVLLDLGDLGSTGDLNLSNLDLAEPPSTFDVSPELSELPGASLLAGASLGGADRSGADLLEPDLLEPDLLEPDLLEPDLLEPDLLEPDLLNPSLLADVGLAGVESPGNAFLSDLTASQTSTASTAVAPDLVQPPPGLTSPGDWHPPSDDATPSATTEDPLGDVLPAASPGDERLLAGTPGGQGTLLASLDGVDGSASDLEPGMLDLPFPPLPEDLDVDVSTVADAPFRAAAFHVAQAETPLDSGTGGGEADGEYLPEGTVTLTFGSEVSGAPGTAEAQDGSLSGGGLPPASDEPEPASWTDQLGAALTDFTAGVGDGLVPAWSVPQSTLQTFDAIRSGDWGTATHIAQQTLATEHAAAQQEMHEQQEHTSLLFQGAGAQARALWPWATEEERQAGQRALDRVAHKLGERAADNAATRGTPARQVGRSVGNAFTEIPAEVLGRLLPGARPTGAHRRPEMPDATPESPAGAVDAPVGSTTAERRAEIHEDVDALWTAFQEQRGDARVQGSAPVDESPTSAIEPTDTQPTDQFAHGFDGGDETIDPATAAGAESTPPPWSATDPPPDAPQRASDEWGTELDAQYAEVRRGQGELDQMLGLLRGELDSSGAGDEPGVTVGDEAPDFKFGVLYDPTAYPGSPGAVNTATDLDADIVGISGLRPGDKTFGPMHKFARVVTRDPRPNLARVQAQAGRNLIQRVSADHPEFEDALYVGIHSAGDTFTSVDRPDLTVEQLADAIRTASDSTGRQVWQCQPIVLHACHSGAKPTNVFGFELGSQPLAAQLADALRVPVVGPTGEVRFHPRTGEVNEVVGKSDPADPDFTVHYGE